MNELHFSEAVDDKTSRTHLDTLGHGHTDQLGLHVTPAGLLLSSTTAGELLEGLFASKNNQG